eukprot:2501893-Rhodomonas_salina.1
MGCGQGASGESARGDGEGDRGSGGGDLAAQAPGSQTCSPTSASSCPRAREQGLGEGARAREKGGERKAVSYTHLRAHETEADL